jgi:hypothetical protein
MKKMDSVLCHNCREIVVVEKEEVNHVLHMIMSVVTGGLWLLVWALMVFTNNNNNLYKCPSCGRDFLT